MTPTSVALTSVALTSVVNGVAPLEQLSGQFTQRVNAKVN